MISALVGVVVRSAGERTGAATIEKIRSAGFETRVVGDRGHPFALVLQEAVEASLGIDREWSLMVDADVILDEGFAEGLGRLLGEVAEFHFVVQPMVFDKVFCAYRSAGLHLYRTEFLRKNRNLLESKPETMRPETFFKRKVLERNPSFSLTFSTEVLGVHEFEQYRSHTFQKAFLKGQKMASWAGPLLRLWTEMAKVDDDFKIMREGFLRGLLSDKLRTYRLRKDGAYWPKSVPGRFTGTVPKSRQSSIPECNQIIRNFRMTERAKRIVETYQAKLSGGV